jgi:hypothetical protein
MECPNTRFKKLAFAPSRLRGSHVTTISEFIMERDILEVN